MKRRKFLKSTLTLGGAAAATTGLTACTIEENQCADSPAATGPLASFEKIGKIQAKSSDQIGHSYWGIQAGAYDEETLGKARAIGVKWTRVLAGWPNVESEKGQFDWANLDTAIDALLKYGITPFVTVTRGNPLYTGTGTYDDPKLAAIYGNSPVPPEDYGNLVRVTSEKIRSLHPDAKIIAGSMAGISPDFTDGFLSRCDPSEIDIISFHNYAGRPEERVYRMPEFQEVLDKYNPDFEVWQGECGMASQSRTTGYRSLGPWGLTIQAKWLLRQSFVDTYFCGATLSNYFKLYSDGELDPSETERELSDLEKVFGATERGGSRMHARGVNEKCILYAADGSPKPAYFAYQNLCAVLDSRFRKEEADYRFEVANPGSFQGIGEYEDAFPSVPLLATYKSSDAALLALCLPWIPQETISEFASVSLDVDEEFKDPVLLDLLTGNAYAVDDYQSSGGETRFGNLPLADYPLIISERNEVVL
jgi:hypothetical protein